MVQELFRTQECGDDDDLARHVARPAKPAGYAVCRDEETKGIPKLCHGRRWLSSDDNPTDATCATRNFMTPQAANAFQNINPFKTGAPASYRPQKKCNFQAPNVAVPVAFISSAGTVLKYRATAGILKRGIEPQRVCGSGNDDGHAVWTGATVSLACVVMIVQLSTGFWSGAVHFS